MVRLLICISTYPSFVRHARRLMLLLTPDLPEREQVRQPKLKLRHEYNALLAFSNVKTLVELKATCLRIEAGFNRNKERTDSRPRNRPSTRPTERGPFRPKNRSHPRPGHRPANTVVWSSKNRALQRKSIADSTFLLPLRATPSATPPA